MFLSDDSEHLNYGCHTWGESSFVQRSVAHEIESGVFQGLSLAFAFAPLRSALVSCRQLRGVKGGYARSALSYSQLRLTGPACRLLRGRDIAAREGGGSNYSISSVRLHNQCMSSSVSPGNSCRSKAAQLHSGAATVTSIRSHDHHGDARSCQRRRRSRRKPAAACLRDSCILYA
jgi:hypothetical protein